MCIRDRLHAHLRRLRAAYAEWHEPLSVRELDTCMSMHSHRSGKCSDATSPAEWQQLPDIA
eukprot:12606136-Alexandrium_andersonii.AAC.1